MARQFQKGPQSKRMALVPLEKMCVDPEISGWRDSGQARVEELFVSFCNDEFGMSVTCAVQIMETESTDNKKLVDDGLATVTALKRCKAAKDASPDATPFGDPWPATLVDIFELGLGVRVVK